MASLRQQMSALNSTASTNLSTAKSVSGSVVTSHVTSSAH